MPAIYPSAVKTFNYRKDYTQIVDASDVNTAYDEITATEVTLGVNPQTQIIDGNLSAWPDVSTRISSVLYGVSKPYCNPGSHNFAVPYGLYTPVSWTEAPWDTHGMTSGTTITCKRDGVYSLNFYVRWHKDGQAFDNQQPVFNRNGKLEISLLIEGSGEYAVAQTGFFPIGYQATTRQTAGCPDVPLLAGQTIQAALYQTTLFGAPITASAFCTVMYQRSAPTTNNL